MTADTFAPSAAGPVAVTPTLDAIERETAAFEQGYRLGWHAGYEVGHGAAYREVFARAEWLAGQPVGTGPSAAELERRRAHQTDPCPARCRRCAQCIYAEHHSRSDERLPSR